MEYVARLFGEAREHQRRRQRGVIIAVAAVLGVIGLLASTTSPVSPPHPVSTGIAAPPGTVIVAPAAVFAQDPYMGVRCPAANSITCDRVGLALWLRRPALAVTATINGRALAMNRFGDQLVAPGRLRTEFDGYLQPAGLRTSLGVRPISGTDLWEGDPTPYPMVWLLIDYGSGHPALTHVRVPLAAGWG
jgi:hypothetical protein